MVFSLCKWLQRSAASDAMSCTDRRAHEHGALVSCQKRFRRGRGNQALAAKYFCKRKEHGRKSAIHKSVTAQTACEPRLK